MNETTVRAADITRFAFRYWMRRPKTLAAVFLLMAAATAVDALVPVYTGRLVDVLAGHDARDAAAMDSALYCLAIFGGLAFLYTVLKSASIYLWNWFAVHNLYEIVTEALRNVQRFSSDWHVNSFAGGTVRKITRGMWSFDVFEDTIFMGLFPAAVITMAMMTMLFLKLPLVGLFTLAMIIVYCGVSIWMSIAVQAPRFRESATEDTKVGATLADIITGNPTVKSFGAETREDGLFHGVARIWRQKAIRAWQTSETANAIRAILRNLMLVGMIGVTVWMWARGEATPGDIALSLTCFFIISGYLRDIGQHIANLQKSASEMEDVVAFSLRRDDVNDAPDAKPLTFDRSRPTGCIAFEKVRFAYANTPAAIYDDFSLTIRPGEKVALVGHSGSGKSTFVKLVQRLYDIQGGAITIDGQDIAKVTQESLRRAVAVVPQEPILFHRSLAANIAYGRPGASMEDIVEAARKAYAHDFIETLPMGYDTMVGERGVKLSGGERQRVAIARAILADAPVLIMDEATSSLDSVSEHVIQKALEALTTGRTTITIAHRLSTIRKVDRILVFDHGRVIEQGSHAELVGREGSHYRMLYEMQAFDLLDGLQDGREAAE